MTQPIATSPRDDAATATRRGAPGEDSIDARRGRLRADAQRNRERILAAAGTVFARRGLQATLDDVAQEAGVGVGTVYRRFRDKVQLAEAVLRADFDELVADATRAATIEDPWDSLATFVTLLVERQARNTGMRDVMNAMSPCTAQAEAIAQRLDPISERIVNRAKAAGVLRRDFDSADVTVVAFMLGAVVQAAGCRDPGLWRRYLALVLDGMHNSPASKSLPRTDAAADTAVRSGSDGSAGEHGTR